MPAFADKLSEEDRWDVVNFLHATSRGYQARLINPYVAPNQPYMAPQNFSYSAHDDSSGTLKDFRRQKAVLLVLFSWPESRARLDLLQQAYATLRDGNVAVLAVPVNDLNQQDLAGITAGMTFPIATQGHRKSRAATACSVEPSVIPTWQARGHTETHGVPD